MSCSAAPCSSVLQRETRSRCSGISLFWLGPVLAWRWLLRETMLRDRICAATLSVSGCSVEPKHQGVLTQSSCAVEQNVLLGSVFCPPVDAQLCVFNTEHTDFNLPLKILRMFKGVWESTVLIALAKIISGCIHQHWITCRLDHRKEFPIGREHQSLSLIHVLIHDGINVGAHYVIKAGRWNEHQKGMQLALPRSVLRRMEEGRRVDALAALIGCPACPQPHNALRRGCQQARGGQGRGGWGEGLDQLISTLTVIPPDARALAPRGCSAPSPGNAGGEGGGRRGAEPGRRVRAELPVTSSVLCCGGLSGVVDGC